MSDFFFFFFFFFCKNSKVTKVTEHERLRFILQTILYFASIFIIVKFRTFFIFFGDELCNALPTFFVPKKAHKPINHEKI